MISGTDINDYRDDNPQQLWQLAEYRDKDKYIEMHGMVFKYGWLDGAYATVYDLHRIEQLQVCAVFVVTRTCPMVNRY